MTKLLLVALAVAACVVQPEEAFEKFKEAYSAATKAGPPVRALVVMDTDLSWKAVTYADQVAGITTRVNRSWLCAASGEEIEHVARHEVCHIRIHGKRLREARAMSDEERAGAENEAEMCVLATNWTR